MLEEEYEPRRRLPPHLRPSDPGEAPFQFVIRAAERGDLPSIREIYNHYVVNSSITFDQAPLSAPALRRRFEQSAQLNMPIIVAVNPTGQVLGYASVFPWKPKASHRFTVENSIYLGPAATGKGLGAALLAELIERSRAVGIREIIAVIADRGADASIRLHERFGFVDIGRMGRVGFKYDRWLGTVMMRKSLRR